MPWKKKKKKNYCTDYCTQNFWSIQAFFGCIELPHNQKIKLLPSHEKKSLRTYSFPIPFLFEFIKDIHIYHQFLELFRSSRIIFLNILLIAVAVLAVINVNISRSLLHLRDTKTTTSLSNMGYIRTIFPDKNVNGYNF